MTTAGRNPDEVFAHHGQSLGAEDLEAIISDYSADAILIVNGEVYRGHDGTRQVFTQLLSEVPQAKWELSTTFAEDILYLEWKAQGKDGHVDDGVDTFVFSNGQIRVQTVSYSVQPG